VKRPWLAEVLRPRRTAREVELEARVQRYVAKAADAEALAEARGRNEKRLTASLNESERRREHQAAVITDLRNLLDSRPARGTATALRLERALRAVVKLRAELAAQSRLVRAQQQRLDQLLGLDTPPVLAGANWQQRRPDKRKEYSA
jgi:hypothetical protein